MNLFLVTLFSKRDVEDFAVFSEILEKHKHVLIGEKTYFLLTNEDKETLYSHIQPTLRARETLLVCEVQGEPAIEAPQSVIREMTRLFRFERRTEARKRRVPRMKRNARKKFLKKLVTGKFDDIPF